MGIKELFGLANRLTNIAKYKGNTDFLEAVCASAALVAAADGNISDDEVGTAIDVIKSNKALTTAFNSREIEKTMDAMIARAKSHSGRATLFRELEDVTKRGDDTQCEDIYLVAMDVAYADNNLGDDEKAMLTKIATRLSVDEKKLAA